MKISKFLKIFAWEVLNPGLLAIKRNKYYKFKPFYKGINLGCGIDNPRGWVGIDGGITHLFMNKTPLFISRLVFKKMKMSGNYKFEDYIKKVKSMHLIHHDIVNGIPLPDETVPYIYSSHLLEHLYPEQAENLLKECFRVLKKNGVIRICVPSLDKIVVEMKHAINQYEQGDIEDIQKFVTSKGSGYISNQSHHRKMFNFKELEKILGSTGFKKIREFESNRGNIPDVELLDTRNGIFVEAVK